MQNYNSPAPSAMDKTPQTMDNLTISHPHLPYCPMILGLKPNNIGLIVW